MKKINKNILVSLVLLSLVILTSFISNKKILNNNKENEIIQNKIEGLYILNSCEKSRFSILIKKTLKNYSFSILDRKKSISKGKVFIRKEEGETIITFGDKMAGRYDNDTIIIQNYGNSMNQYIHFTQCGEKYLSFEKK